MTDLTPPSLSKAAKQAIAVAAQANAPGSGEVHSEMMRRVDDAQKKGDWLKARFLLEEIRDARKASASDPNDASAEDPYILQRLALATYKSKHPTPADAFVAARDLLLLLDPKTSNDTETLGLWGSVHKRTWETTKDPAALDEAIRGYERGFYLRNDYYNGINYAYLLNVRAARAADLGDAIADYVQARRVRQEVIPICEESLQEIEKEGADVKARVDQAFATKQDSTGLNSTRYWILATLAEAHVGLEDGLGDAALEKALAAAPEEWMKQSTQEQIDKLKVLVTNSPLKKLPAGGIT